MKEKPSICCELPHLGIQMKTRAKSELQLKIFTTPAVHPARQITQSLWAHFELNSFKVFETLSASSRSNKDVTGEEMNNLEQTAQIDMNRETGRQMM